MPRVILPDDPHAVSREISQADYDHAVEQQGMAQRLHEDPSGASVDDTGVVVAAQGVVSNGYSRSGAGNPTPVGAFS
jgi:DNA topoisomerase VI subunit A